MINFDISSHFDRYENHFFYNQIPYSKLKEDVQKIKHSFFEQQLPHPVGLKMQNPYWSFVSILACLVSKNKSVLLSYKENENSINNLKNQIYFEQVLDDKIISKALLETNNLSSLSIESEIDHLVYCFTSGSSAAPKAVALSFKNFYFSSLGFIEFINLQPKETSYLNLPHHHVGGLMVLWRSFLSGSRVTDVFELPVDYISLVPTQLQKMIENQDDLKKLQSAKCILIGGAPLYENLKAKCNELRLNIFETYGMTETCSLVTLNGKILPYRNMQLNKENCFCISGDILSSGYFQNNQFSPINSPFQTNDIGEIFDGKFKFKERKDLVFISGGENINPLHIEEIASKFPFVESACCSYVDDEKWGQMSILLYQASANDKFRECEFLDFLKQHLHPYQVPKFVFNTHLIQSHQTKINRKAARELALKLYLEKIFSFEYMPSLSNSKDTIVFFHGFMGDKLDLKKIALAFQNQFNLLLIDLPGHGKTSMNDFHSLLDIFSKITRFVQLFTSNPIFYGYSMGGRIALELSHNHFKPKALILESAGLGLIDKNECEERLKSDRAISTKIISSSTESFLEWWYQNPIFFKYNQSDIFKEDIINKLKSDRIGWSEAIVKFSPAFFPYQSINLKNLKEINFPLLYIAGEKDEKYQRYASLLQSMKFDTLIIKECGHNPHKTHPLDITNYLSDWLK